MYRCVTIQVDSSQTDLFTSSWSHSHIDLCGFKGSVLVPLEWGHQTLSCFEFLTYPHTSCMCSPLVMWPKSNHIAVFALDLKSTYEGEHTIIGLLRLAWLTSLRMIDMCYFKWIYYCSSLNLHTFSNLLDSIHSTLQFFA
jgi:hypothetical protein